MPCWDNSTEQRTERRDCRDENQHRSGEGRANVRAKNRRQSTDEQRSSQARYDESHTDAGCAEKHAFHQRLPHKFCARGAQRDPDREFTPAG